MAVGLAVLWGMTCMPLAAQTGSLHLEGIVWDPAGNPLPGVALSAVDDATGRRAETVSDSDGYYRFMVLQPGAYTVTAKAQGFKDVVQRNVHILVPGGAALNISFEVAAIDNEVGPVERPRTLDSDLADAFGWRDLQDYPLLDRNPLALATVQPGVQIDGGNEAASAVNGTLPTMATLTRDGLTETAPLSPGIGRSLLPINIDAVSDVQVITSNAGAAYGGAGAQVVLTSRQGAAKWTGNFYDYFNSHHLDATGHFADTGDLDRPEAMRNIFGGVVSGRLTSKTAIFGSYEGVRNEQQVYRNRLVLTGDTDETDVARLGVFRWYAPNETTFDDDTVQKFNIPVGAAAQSVIDLMPVANNYRIGDGVNTAGYEFNGDTHYHQHRADVRVDHDIDARHHIFARVNWSRTDATDTQNGADAAYPGLNSGLFKTNDFGITVGSDYVLSPTMVNELRVGYVRTDADYERPDRAASAMPYSAVWTDPLNPSYPKSYRFPAFEVSDTFSHSRNVHAFKYGFSLRRTTFGSTDYSGAYPTVTFGNSNGAAPANIGPLTTGVNTNGTVITADDILPISADGRTLFEHLYNTMTGRVESVSQTFYANADRSGWLPAGSARERRFTSWALSGFVQDDWKVKPNVTLNLGVRYELFTAPKESNGYQSRLDKAGDIGSGSDLGGIANIGDFRVVKGVWYKSDKLNFAPRVGLAWDAYGDGSTVVRAAYGIYYDQLGSGVVNFIDRNSYGFEQSVTCLPYSTDAAENCGAPQLFDAAYSIPVTATQLTAASTSVLSDPEGRRARNIAILDDNLKTPRVHQMHATLERRWAGLQWEVGYSRTRGTKLFQYLNLNQNRAESAGELLTAFQELRSYRECDYSVIPSTACNNFSPNNALLDIFGTPLAALNALEGDNFSANRYGAVVDALDRAYNPATNQYVFDTGTYNSPVAASEANFYIRHFPQFDQFIYGTNAADSWYDAVRVGARKTGANYGFKAFYTWSRSKDTVSGSSASYVAPADSFNLGAGKGYSDFHRNHVFTFAWRYALPFGRDLDEETDQPGWVNAFLANWTIGMLGTYESGARFSVTSGMENQFAGVNGLADLDRTSEAKIGELYRDSQTGILYWIDPTTGSQFNAPEAGVSGTSERNAFAGPRYFNIDISMHKSFRVRESQAIQVRLEAYNVMNRTHYGLPDANLGSSGFGTITSTVGTPRKLQFAVRYQF
ncbi:MAG: TonB-dependent receptor [Acidobacteriota bacterium]|jgi:hypothetical protein|nr:TonB-dependent receptor [Acidobacteriota bacterium]